MSASRRAGYTLIELVVVVLIIGVLAAVAVPQYLKTLETSKADDAAGLVNQVGTTNRMFALDHSGYYVQGSLSAACGTGTCPSSVSATVTPACVLVWCGYLADQDWGSKPYTVCACDGKSSSCSCGGSGFSSGSSLGLVSAAQRASTASAPYNSWGYSMDASGKVSPSPASNGPPTPTF